MQWQASLTSWSSDPTKRCLDRLNLCALVWCFVYALRIKRVMYVCGLLHGKGSGKGQDVPSSFRAVVHLLGVQTSVNHFRNQISTVSHLSLHAAADVSTKKSAAKTVCDVELLQQLSSVSVL